MIAREVVQRTKGARRWVFSERRAVMIVRTVATA